MAAGHQLRLLLWKDYLIRKRKWITLAGVTWAVAVIFSLYIVRINIDNQDFPTCQFPARALPSAGLLTFVQSFVCSVNNDCSPMDQFQEIPTYEGSKLTQLQRQFSPLLYNETVLDVASTVPDALKLLATLADIVDQPTFVDISKNGLKVRDLFLNPRRVKRYLTSELDISEDVAESIMSSELQFQGLFKGSIDRCNSNSISNIVSISNTHHQEVFVQKLCSLSNANIQKIAIKLILEVNYQKYMAMIGDMYFKLAGDRRLTQLGEMVAAILRMAKVESFLPSEIVTVFLNDDVDFNYFNLTIIPKLMDLFEPTFGDTQSYQTLKDFTDAAVTGFQYLNRIVRQPTDSVIDDLRSPNANKTYHLNTQLPTEVLKNAIAVFEESNAHDSSVGVFNVLAQITKVIYKFLPDTMKSDVSFYSTLLAKLMEGALKVIDINMHIQEMAYNVSLRNTEGVKVLIGLPSHVVSKGFEALADAERTQILTSKLNTPDQMFCDSNRIANFFVISKTEADSLKKKLCTNAWKSYILDLIQSFGIYEVKDNINAMASLVVQKTIGRDISEQLYSIDKIFSVLKNFTSGLTEMRTYEEPHIEWQKVFNLTDDSSFMKVVRAKGHLGKQMLITVHGALAKEVVKQNPLLEYKISPTLIDMTIIVGAINDQLGFMPLDLVARVKKLYPEIIQTMLMTILDERKTYKSLSTPSTDIVCNGSAIASSYLILLPNIDEDSLVSALCDTATVIENGLKKDSVLAKAILQVMNRTRPVESINWTKLINNVKTLYMTLNADYPYLFEYKTYGMDEETQAKVHQMLEDAREFWFSWSHIERSLHLSVKLVFRLLDLMDRDIFNIKDDMWLKMKQGMGAASGPISIVNDIILEVTALVNNETYTSRLPSKTSLALAAIVPNVPHLIVDFVNVIINDNTDIEPIITLMNSVPAWPCSTTSLAEYLELSENSKTAVKGFEELLCLDTELQQQWKDYMDMVNVSDKTPHVFLKFSSAFDYFIDDVVILRRTLNDVLNANDSSDDRLTLVNAWKYAVDTFNNTDSVDTFGKLFSKIDTVLSSIHTLSLDGKSTSSLWEEFMKCSNGTLIGEECKAVGRSAWRHSLKSLSVMLVNIADDLMTYFREVNEPNSNLLQMLGFTKRTGLYILYDKLPEFVGALINSYWDYGFMSQIRRASLSEFWDCDAVLDALLPLPGSGIDTTTIQKVKPIVCPSLLHWISLPRGENTLLDIFAKPQYFFYTLPVQNLTSNYKNAFIKATELANLLTDIANKNETIITEEDVHINSIEDKLRRAVDTILTYKINAADQSYRLFNEINTKQFYAVIYLSRIVSSINKLSVAMDNITANDLKSDISDADLKKLTSELSTIQKIFKRRPSDAVALFFDVITDVIWKNNDDYKLTNSLDVMCDDLNKNDTSRDILNEGNRTKRQICAKDYKLIYGAIENVLMEDKEQTRQSLLNLINVLQNGDDGEVNDIFTFLNQRKQLIKSLKYSIKYAYDLGIPIYLKYLQNNLENYNIVLSFLAGNDWWSELRALYNGPHVSSFFNAVEKSFEIAEDILTKLDGIHLVRLLRDIEVNSSTAFCQPNLTLSDYIPDSTGALSEVKRKACETNKQEVFMEILPLVFVSQGYAAELKLSKDVNYTAVNAAITKTESNLELIKDGPKSPERPHWMTDEKIARLRTVALQLLSKESLAKIAFGITGNIIDAGTLFLNGSNCILCSEFTTWFKQINLQLIKKQEYDSLLCHMHSMSLEDIHHALKNDFHWDITVGELISSRNYTKYEMNKSVGELLEQVKLHLLEDLTANTTKLGECLAKNVSRNEFGNATLFMSVLAHTARLIRAELPHFHEVEGMKEVPYLKKLLTEIAHKLDAWAPLEKYIMEKNLLGQLKKIVDDKLARVIEKGDINLRAISTVSRTPLKKYISIRNQNWNDICKQYNCDNISNIIYKSLNKTLAEMDLPKLQEDQFWRFGFVSNIIRHSEVMVGHLARLLGLASRMDVGGASRAHLAALIDLLMQILNDDILSGIVFSVQGIVAELRPLLHQTPLEHDLVALTDGLLVLHQFKTSLLENNDLKVEVSPLFREPENVETSLSRLGINNTNFWSIAAPRIHAGYLKLKPIFTAKDDDYHISRFVCQPEWMSMVVVPADLDVVTAEDVFSAVAEQFCPLSDEHAKQVVVALMENLNYSYIIEKVTNILLTKLYTASNLSQPQGSAVLDSLPQMAALLPTIQASVGDLSDTLTEEPLFQSLKNFSSVGNLISSSEFMSSAGNMLCGKPFYADISRLYKTVIQAEDMSDQPSKAQLDILPTDFCRSLYTDIINVEGGKIVWSFVKPLIMGRILYTPNTPLVQKIVEKANNTFSHMIKLTGLVHSFARAFSSVDKLSQHRAGVSVLKGIISSPTFSELRSSLIGDQQLPDVDIDGLFDEFGDLKGVGGLLTKASDVLQCINLNRFKAMSDEVQLTHTAAKLSMVNEFSAGLVFLNSEEQQGVPANIEYKIRMDIDNVPTTTRMKNYMWTPGPEAVFIENMRYFRGFVQIQDMIDRAIIEVSKNTSSRQKRDTSLEDDSKWTVYTQQMPYPCYRKDYFQTGMYESQALLVAFFFSMLYTVASAVRFMVVDKESGNTMLMSVMGVDLKYHTISWFIASFIEMTITCACVAAVLCLGNILPHTTPSMVFALLFIFGISVLCFCYLVSKLFSTASFAAVCAAIAYLITFMPIILILSLEAVMSSSYKIFVCLSMSSALCYAFLYIARYEAMGVGASWSDFWSSPIDEGSDMSIGIAAGMMLLDAVIYLAAGWLIDRFFGPKTLRSNITNCMTTSEKAGVSIVNITKVYNEGSRRAKLALDNVSIELHKGQITTLLGHNGAGKTTLIKILMGMLKPSKGHVTIRSGLQAGTSLGVCPQGNVLFEYMTAREHIALYAQLKSGLPLPQVTDEVESLVLVLSLGPVSDEPVCRLSGGTRRRLCVALAFVARPLLVSLDEPTSGVDPAARRDIWSMIVKLREDRTILLTTHHLDEAELLSDQIVIMHKGQVHTTGSPIDIKRTLGTGYKLTVMYPKRNQEEPWIEDEEVTIEERTKQLMAVVRDVVKNASLADVCGNEVEITLPFFDANGLNNNFLQLCTALEMRQEALAFNNYTMECSSLEQVFFNICREADTPHAIEYDITPRASDDTPSKSASTSSIRNDNAPLVDGDGPLKGSTWQQFLALMYGRYIHYKRNRWLLFLLIVLPSLFVTVAMSFSTIRPPADNELSLRLSKDLYPNTTQFLIPNPSIVNSTADPAFARRVMDLLRSDEARNWTQSDSPTCKCTDTRHVCDTSKNVTTKRPAMMLLPDVHTLNEWIVDSHELYIEKRYGGFSSTLKNNVSTLVAWYNNKGHHALPALLNAVNVAVLRATTGKHHNITTYTHPLKISKEQISKDTVYQHIADAGISALVLIAYSLVSAGSAIYLVSARRSQEKRLQLLCGVSPALYWMTALVWDMIIIIMNMVITVVVMEAFHFPVFVARENLPAICILILLFGYASSCLVHVLEKLFSEPSMANMILFCGGTFVGLAGIALLLILDVISQSDTTDNVRKILHKVFLLSPQFALGDGMLEIAKNTIQAQVLSRFGMDTYRRPFSSDLIVYHCLALVLVGTALLLLNLAIEYDLFEGILLRFRTESMTDETSGEMEELEVAAERQRVEAAVHHAANNPVRLHTIGNINAGFVDTEGNTKSKSLKRMVSRSADVVQCVGLGKAYSVLAGTRLAVRGLTLGIPYGQCTALLGQNGAGKSTTFAMLTGETRPTAGQIYLNGRPVKPRDLCRGFISYCPQSDAIDPLLTVRETLTMYCRLRGITEENDVIRRTLDMFELHKYADMLSGALSGGNKRKLCAAIAFMGRSPLVLLDEPTSGTDPLSLASVSVGVRRACAAGRGVLLSTHALHHAGRLAARVALMRRGRLCALAPLDVCLQRFGGGYIVQCRGSPRALWRRLSARGPLARLRVMHHAALHVLLPVHGTVDGKEVTMRVSDIFRLMSELQSTCDLEDYTINQSSLDQMFLSFTDKGDMDLETVEVEPLPSPRSLRKNGGKIQTSSQMTNGELHTYPEISKIESDNIPGISTNKETHTPLETLRKGEFNTISPSILRNGELHITSPIALENGELQTSLEIIRKNSDPSPSSRISFSVQASPENQRRNSEELNSVTSL